MGSLLNSVRSALFGQPVLQPTDVVDEMRSAGLSFASLVENVGTAVAKAQTDLDVTASKIAGLMATTQVETVQAIVSNYNDSGNLTSVEVITGQTSALAIAVPPALAFREVQVNGCFVASEFSATSTSNVNVNLAGFSIGSHGFGLRGPSISAVDVNVNTNVETAQTQDSSVGTMSVTACVVPKPVDKLPIPPLTFKGPTLTIATAGASTVTPVNPAPNLPTDPPYLERRSQVVKFLLVNASNTALGGKTIGVDCGELNWGVCSATGAPLTTAPTTDSTGIFYILVERLAPAATEPRKSYQIRGSLNLVNGTCSVSL